MNFGFKFGILGKTGGFYKPLEAHPDWYLLDFPGPSSAYINGNKILLDEGGDEHGIAFGDEEYLDVEVSGIVLYESPSNDAKSFPLAVRMQDANTAIGMRLYNDDVEVYERIGGAFSLIYSLPGGGAGVLGTEMKLRVTGDIITVTVKGVEYVSPTPTTLLTAGRVGIIQRDWNEASLGIEFISKFKAKDLLPFEFIWGTTEDSQALELPLPTGFNYDMLVFWGDGTHDTITAWDDLLKTHTYATTGDYTVRIFGLCETWYNTYNSSFRLALKEVTSIGNVGFISLNNAFYYCSNLTTFNGIGDASNITDMRGAFYNCTGLTSLDLSSWDVSSATDITNLFHGCSGLTSLDVANWNTSSVTIMASTFNGCTGLTSLDVANWDVSNVTDINSIFYNCTGLTSLDVANWDTSSATNIYNVFYGCTGLTSLDLSSWDVSNVTTMTSLFQSCSGLTSLDIANWDTGSVTDMRYLFRSCTSLTSVDIANWDVSSTTDISGMSQGCSGLTSVDIANWDTSSATSIGYIFYGCTSLTSIDVANWDVSSTTDISGMFQGCSGLTSLNITNWNTSSFKYISSMFQDCSSLTSLDLSSWDTSSIISLFRVFQGCSGLTSLNIANWDTLNITSMDSAFYLCSGLTSLDIANWDVSSVTNLTNMLFGTDIGTASYDPILINWSAQVLKTGVRVHFGTAKYSAGGAAEAGRNVLTGTYSWIVTDGGPVVSIVTHNGEVVTNNGEDVTHG